MWAYHWWSPLLPAPADSPPSGLLAPLPELSFGLLEREKSGPDWFSGAFGRNLSLLTQVMLQRERDSELGIGDFRLRTPRNEKPSGPRGLVDHGRGKGLSGALRASSFMRFRACMDPKKILKVWLIVEWYAEESLCITCHCRCFLRRTSLEH